MTNIQDIQTCIDRLRPIQKEIERRIAGVSDLLWFQESAKTISTDIWGSKHAFLAHSLLSSPMDINFGLKIAIELLEQLRDQHE
jgi:hypothetical protein